MGWMDSTKGDEMSRGPLETLRRVRRTPSPHENRHLFPKIETLPGSLHAERKRCNRPTCRCAAGGDALHGPYLYRRWLENGRLRSRYVRPADAERVRAALAEWRRLHPPARSLRDELAELRRLFRQFETVGV